MRGGTVVDGTGADARRADVRVVDGVIVTVEPDLRPIDGESVIDASDALVTPGFIDSHTHFDPTLWWDPTCDPLAVHGVTSILIGNCSLSLAPAPAAHRDEIAGIFSYIEDIPRDVMEHAVPWSWNSFSEYQSALAERRYGVNVGSLVGHSALRLSVMGSAAWERAAADDERAALAAAMAECMRAGAFGLSTSFFDKDADDRAVPSRLADDAEFRSLIDAVADGSGLLAFIPDVTRRSFLDDLERIASLCGPRDVVSTWNSLYHDDRRPRFAGEVLDHAASLQEQGRRIYPQISPRPVDVRVNWNGGMSFFLLPNGWHRFVQAQSAEKAAMIGDPEWRHIAREEWDATTASFFPHRRPERVTFTSVSSAADDEWVGRSLADLAAAWSMHPSDALADWVERNDLFPGVIARGVFNGNVDAVGDTLAHPAAVWSNSDAGAHLQMQCAAGDTTLLLTRYVRDQARFSIEHAVHQLTGRHAELFGFGGRGIVAPGKAADLVVFSLEELTWAGEVEVDDLPGGAMRLRRPPGGYRTTIVGGTVVQHAGVRSGALPGRLLKPEVVR